jgi:hypothetical protein
VSEEPTITLQIEISQFITPCVKTSRHFDDALDVSFIGEVWAKWGRLIYIKQETPSSSFHLVPLSTLVIYHPQAKVKKVKLTNYCLSETYIYHSTEETNVSTIR